MYFLINLYHLQLIEVTTIWKYVYFYPQYAVQRFHQYNCLSPKFLYLNNNRYLVNSKARLLIVISDTYSSDLIVIFCGLVQGNPAYIKLVAIYYIIFPNVYKSNNVDLIVLSLFIISSLFTASFAFNFLIYFIYPLRCFGIIEYATL